MYLYHTVPDRIVGHEIVPLEAVKAIAPKLYKKYREGYHRREHILSQRIELLQCRWSEVVFLTAVHPRQLAEVLVREGHQIRGMRFFAISVDELDPTCLSVQQYKKEKAVELPFRFEDLPEYGKIPAITTRYYYEMYAWRKKPHLFHGIPHIFYKGTINVAECAIIEV